MRKKLTGLADASTGLIEDSAACEKCGATIGVVEGTCLHCFLGEGLESEGEASRETFQSVLTEADVPDKHWHLGQYEILEEIGRGGMGVIYRARQRHSRRIVALKRILSYQANSNETLVRFRREAEAVAALDHPNIVPIYEVSESEDRLPFFSMKYATGGSLRTAAPALLTKPRESVRLLAKVARAIAYAHDRGILHRDLQPGNILLDGNGEPLVSDFGLAKLLDAGSDLTRTLTSFGTPGYIAPEQAESAAGDLAPTADVYSLGAILCYLLTGRPPFVGANVLSVIHQAAATPAPRLRSLVPSLDRDLETIVSRCLEREPQARYQTAGGLAEDLERWIEGRPILSRRVFPPAHIWRWARRNPVLAAAITGCLLLAAAVIWLLGGHAAPVAISEKSIAVLPFENLSTEKENAFFAVGVQDDILSALAKVADLKVIARTSVMNYGAGPGRDLREIGQALGVANVLEGSVRRAGDKVRVTAQLIDTRTNQNLWAETYDRNLADVFVIQSEIAQEIAEQLQTKLSPREKAAMARPPTTDLAAFDFYSRAKEITLTANFSALGEEKLLRAADLLTQAVGRDPAFFLAWCQLATVHDQLYFLGIDHTPARLASGDVAVQQAIRLQPDSGEAHLARAQHFYRGYLDYERAKAELAIAQRTLPNDPQTFELAGYIDRREGRWEESTRNLKRALELDPRNFFTLQQIALSYEMLRRYPEMAGVLDQALAIVPKDVETRVARALVELDWRADPGPLRATIDAILAEDPALAPTFADNWLTLTLCERDPAAAARAWAALDDGGVQISAVQLSRPFWEGMVARVRGDEVAARAAFTKARTMQEEAVRAQPDYAPALCVLGLIDAGLGRTEDALREGRRAVELLPVARDSINGAYMIEFFAMICAWTGEKDLAFQQLALALRNPGTLSYGQLKLHPFWDALRGDPRFEKIIASRAPEALTPGKSIAVLPFDNLSGDPENAYFADGIKDEMLTRLSKIAALKVISGGSTQKFANAPDDVRAVAKQLGVANILRGSVRKSGETVRVTAQLLNAQNSTQLWAETYDRKLTDMFQVESEVAQRIAASLETTLSGAEKRALEARPTTDLKAYQAYLKGRYFWNKRTDEGYQKAGEYFREAIAIDPNYAPAYAGLSDVHQFNAFNAVGRTDLPVEAREAAQKAIALDGSLAEPHASLGLLLMNYDWDWATAEKEFQRAIELNSNYATAHHWYAEYLIAVNRPEEALVEIQRARELDPLSLIINTDTGKMLYFARRYDDAIKQLRETLKMDSNFPQAHIWLGSVCATTGLYDEALAEFAKVNDNSWTPGWLGYVYGVSGRRDEAEKILHQLKQSETERPIDPHVLVCIYTGFGDKEQVFAALEKDYEMRSVGLMSLKVHPWYDSLRSDPRFTDLLRRTNLAR